MRWLLGLCVAGGLSAPSGAAIVPQSDALLALGLSGYVTQVDADVGTTARLAFDNSDRDAGLALSGRGQMGPFAVIMAQYQSHFRSAEGEYRHRSQELSLAYGRRNDHWIIEALAGARYLKQDLQRAGHRCCAGHWQPLVGVQLAYQLMSRGVVSLHSDYAFRGDEFSSRQQLAIGWELTHHWQLDLAYQWLLFERDTSVLPLDGTEKGLLLGVRYQWY